MQWFAHDYCMFASSAWCKGKTFHPLLDVAGENHLRKVIPHRVSSHLLGNQDIAVGQAVAQEFRSCAFLFGIV